MAKIALTQQLRVAEVPFRNITRSIMIHSNNERKLKGFGQCIAAWLDMWRAGELQLESNENWQEIVENDAALDHVIYLSLAADQSECLRAWKEALQLELKQRITIAQSILALTELFLNRVD